MIHTSISTSPFERINIYFSTKFCSFYLPLSSFLRLSQTRESFFSLPAGYIWLLPLFRSESSDSERLSAKSGCFRLASDYTLDCNFSIIIGRRTLSSGCYICLFIYTQEINRKKKEKSCFYWLSTVFFFLPMMLRPN